MTHNQRPVWGRTACGAEWGFSSLGEAKCWFLLEWWSLNRKKETGRR